MASSHEVRDGHPLTRGRSDPAIDASSGSENISPVMTLEDLSRVRIMYGKPPKFNLVLPRVDDRVNTPPPGRIGMYEEALRTGLRFPVHPLVLGIFWF